MGNRVWVKFVIVITISIGMISTMPGDVVGTQHHFDYDLADANASFIGESAGDDAGLTIAEAGDVNGDGYDDILIGAQHNDVLGYNTGKVYLIFGNSTGWGMDIDLSNADASFVGEFQQCSAGSGLAGAGDVNGDGYDDILIGASSYSNSQGRTYLIFGKPSGWTRDTSLSNADAAFKGDGSSGRAVALVGDVNGDGFDDFLIAAPWNDEGDTNAGQTYLIFGKSSGWIFDGDLINANASFIGEGHGDNSGLHIAGAGDVNGDGFDDFMISAQGNDEAHINGGQTYLILGKASGWSIGTNLSSVDASFLGEAKNAFSGLAIDGAGDVNGDGYSDILIGAGTSGQGGSPTGNAYLVLGRATGWSMDTNISNANVTFLGDEGSFSTRSIAGAGDVNGDGYDDVLIGGTLDPAVGDEYGRGYLILGQSSAWSAEVNLSAANASFDGESDQDPTGLMVDSAGDVNGDGNDDILISAPHNDEGGINAGQTYLLFFDDGLPPKIDADMTATNATTGDPFTFNVTASDTLGIMNASIEYWYGGSPAHANQTANLTSGDSKNGTWVLNITIPSDSLETLHYIVHVMDWSSVLTSSGINDVAIEDDDPPVLRDDLSDTLATTGDPFEFKVNLTDNIGVMSAHVIIWWGAGDPINNTMTTEGGGIWTNQIWIPPYSLEPMNYRFEIVDTSGNWNVSDARSIVPKDNESPVLVADQTPSEVTTGEDLTFSVRLTDNIGIDNAMVSYMYNYDAPTNVPMTPGPYFSATITVDDIVDSLGYVIIARDVSGNEMTTPIRRITIIDDDPPTLVNDLTPRPATTGDPLTFRAEVTDNVGVQWVRVEFWFANDLGSRTDAFMTEDPPGIWSVTFPVPSDSLDMIKYGMWVSDSSDNQCWSLVKDMPVRDNDGPEIELIIPVKEVIKGMPVDIICECSDNIEIDSIHVLYWYGGGEVHNESTGTPIRLEVPRHPGGDLHLIVSSVDTTGNWNSTEEYRIPLTNLPPEIAELLTWNVMESTDAEFGVLNHINDPNDDSFTIICHDEDVIVDGMILKVRHDVVIPDRTITLTISDGDDVVEAALTIHVVNVNDLPVIVDAYALNGPKFNVNEKVTFIIDVTDEDLDELTVTWKDGETVLGTGETLVYGELKSGKHTITVTVSDGEATVEDTLEVTIMKEEESPGFNFVILMFAVVSAAVIAITRRDHCRVRRN